MFKWFKKKQSTEEQGLREEQNNKNTEKVEQSKKSKKNLEDLKNQKKQYREEKEKKRQENKIKREQEQINLLKQQEEEKLKRNEELKKQQKLKQEEFEKRNEEKLKKQKETKVLKKFEEEPEEFDLFGYKLQDLKQGMEVKAKVLRETRDEYILGVENNFKEVYMLKEEALSELMIGDELEVLIYRHTNDDFYVSQRRLKNAKVMKEVKNMAVNNEQVKGKVIAFEGKNYIVELENDLKGFVYYNNIALDFIKEPEQEVGKEYDFLIKEVFPQNKYKVELTRIPLLKTQLQENLDKVEVGSIITIQEFTKNRAGIEFKYEGFKVFIPYKLLSHSFIDEESDITYLIGKEAKVTECEETKFGYNVVANAKELEGNPFETYVKDVAEGDEVSGKVSRIEHYGMFIELAPGVRALLHKNDYSLDFIKDIDDLTVGSEVTAKIKIIEEAKRQIDLTV